MHKYIIFLIIILFNLNLFGETNISYVTNKEIFAVKDKKEGIKNKKVEQYLKKRELLLEKENEKNMESPIRRFEIIFFSSGTIAYLSSMLFLKLFAEFTIGYSSELPDEYWYYIVLNSTGVGLYIAFKDYYDNKNYYKKVEKQNKNDYKLSLIKIKF